MTSALLPLSSCPFPPLGKLQGVLVSAVTESVWRASPRNGTSPRHVAQASRGGHILSLQTKVGVCQIERWEGHARPREQLVQRLRERGFLAPVSALAPRARLLPRPRTKVLLTYTEDGMSPSLWRTRGGLGRQGGRGGKEQKGRR